METTEQGLRRAICVDPFDDAPRLIYADWLDEHGHHSWAEIIREQIREPAFSHTFSRVGWQKYLTPYRRIPSPIARLNLQHLCRGFIFRIETDLGVLLEKAGSIFFTHPLTNIWIFDVWPATSGDGSTWWSAKCPDDGTEVVHQCLQKYGHRSFLPHEIFVRLERYQSFDTHACVYPRGSDAHKAMRKAVISYGRELAGLPPLPDRG